MSNNDFMYAVERSDEYLAHYGIRGMKWGVRRAIASGNSNRLDRQYKKAQKKLAKLEKQAGNSKKYARRAALMGAGAAAAGGLAVAGTGGVSNALKATGRFGGKAMRTLGNAAEGAGRAMLDAHKHPRLGSALMTSGRNMRLASNKVSTGLNGAHHVVNEWGRSTSISDKARKALTSEGVQNLGRNYHGAMGQTVRNAGGTIGKTADKAAGKLKGVSNNTIARIGAGAVGAGLAVGAARNAYKAATAKKRAEKFRSAMNESFKGTKYANGGQPRQGNKKRRNRG